MKNECEGVFELSDAMRCDAIRGGNDGSIFIADPVSRGRLVHTFLLMRRLS